MNIAERLALLVSHVEAIAIERDALRALAVEHGGASAGLDPRTFDRDVVGVMVALGLGDLFAADVARGARPMQPEQFAERWDILDEPPTRRGAPLRAPYSDGNATVPGQHAARGRSKPRRLPSDTHKPMLLRDAPITPTVEGPHEPQ